MVERARLIEPPELAALVDVSERPRVDDWSMRAALTRYAQPEPARVAALLNCVRRLEFALADHQSTLKKRGPEVWAAFQDRTDDSGGSADVDLAPVVALLRALEPIDRLGDVLATWAVTGGDPRPDGAVDDAVAATERTLVELGVPEQERPGPPPGARRRG